MKICELMDNDLLMYGGHLCRFVIRANDACVERLSDGNTYPPCAVYNAEPIPLTNKFLESNDFEERGEDESYYCLFPSNDYTLTIRNLSELFVTFNHLNNGKGRPRSMVNVPVRYVHELQNVLRCVGLCDMANDLSVVALDGTDGNGEWNGNIRAIKVRNLSNDKCCTIKLEPRRYRSAELLALIIERIGFINWKE